MQGRENPAGIPVEHVVCLVVSYSVYDSSRYALDIDIRIFRAYFPAYHYETCAAECLACYFCLRILSEEFIEDGIRNLVRHLVRVAFRY